MSEDNCELLGEYTDLEVGTMTAEQKTFDDLIALATAQSAALLDTLGQLAAATQEGSLARAAAESCLRRAKQSLDRLVVGVAHAHAEDIRPKGARVTLVSVGWERREPISREIVRRTPTQVVLRDDYPSSGEERYRLSDGKPAQKIRSNWRICDEDLEKLRAALPVP